MPFNYLPIKRGLALRLAQIIGSDQGTLETAYTDAWATMLDGAEIPLTAFKDLILAVEKELAQIIGNNPADPTRALLYGRTTALANLAATPTVDANGYEFVGVWDSCADGTTNAPLTWTPTQTLADTSDSFFDDTELYYYNITGNQLRHSRATAYLQGCVWDYALQSTAYDADGDSPLPEFLAATLMDGVTARSAQIGWTDAANVVPYYSNLYQQGIAILQNGTTVPLASSGNLTAG